MLEIPDTGCYKGKSLSVRSNNTGEFAKDKTSERIQAARPMFFSGPSRRHIVERADIP
jgi:hypothetical protein